MFTEVFTLTDGRNSLKLVQEHSGYYQFQFKRGHDPYETVWLSYEALDKMIDGLILYRLNDPDHRSGALPGSIIFAQESPNGHHDNDDDQ